MDTKSQARLDVLTHLVARLYETSFQHRDLSLPEINAELAELSDALTAERREAGGQDPVSAQAVEDEATMVLDHILQMSLTRMVS
jgi:hypothetical protein